MPEQEDGGSMRTVELGEARADDVALLFAQAFQNDPVLVYGCPSRC